MNINFLTLSALKQYEPQLEKSSEEAALCAKLYTQLREALLATVERNFEMSRSVFENYDPKTGGGTGVKPFTGWTALIAMIQSETFLSRVGSGDASHAVAEGGSATARRNIEVAARTSAQFL